MWAATRLAVTRGGGWAQYATRTVDGGRVGGRWGPARHQSIKAATGASTPAPVYDVVVVGGGVVGSVLATRLASSPSTRHLSIAVIENAVPATVASCAAASDVDLRVFAITPASRRVLQSCGAWQHIAATGRDCSYDSMQVWDALNEGVLRFDAREVGSPDLGTLVENRLLQAAMFEALNARTPTVSLFCPASVTSLALPPTAEDRSGAVVAPSTAASPHALPTVTMADGKAVQARLLVGADGANSRVRSSAGIGVWGWDYDQRGVVATVRTEGAHGTAWQRFLPTGPLAILPVSTTHSSIVWSTTPAHAAELEGMTPDQFVASLNRALTATREEWERVHAAGEPMPSSPSTPYGEGIHHDDAESPLYKRQRDMWRLNPLQALTALAKDMDAHIRQRYVGETHGAPHTPPSSTAFRLPPRVVALAGPRASFPLRLQNANTYIGNRVALIGDAAHTVHPLAGQGLNLGIADAEALAQALIAAVERGGDVGSPAVLHEFNQAQYARNTAMLAGLDIVKRVFSSSMQGAPLVHWPILRSFGMHAINLSPMLKGVLAGVAMGDPASVADAVRRLAGAAPEGVGPQLAAKAGEVAQAGHAIATAIIDRVAEALKRGAPGPWPPAGGMGGSR